MVEGLKDSIHYLRAPRDYFWQWSEKGGVAEWIDGATICYQEVLFTLLKELQVKTLPPIGPFLLVLHATRERVGSREHFRLAGVLRKYADKELENKLERVEAFLQTIYELPVDLRLGQHRILLFQELFGLQNGVLNSDVFLQWINELNSGHWNAEIMKFREDTRINLLKKDLAYFDRLLLAFPNSQILETKLRTGIERLPPPLDIELPENRPTDLLDRLTEQRETVALARIARTLLPVINIPLHAGGAGNLPVGGISDITNRGTYDKLLLSELAQDELLLTARLVNNEALFFQREIPPLKPGRRKVVLIDSTIKMWGMPRVFAISAALAFVNNLKHGEEVDSYLLGADIFEKVLLSETQGVINALGRLHHGLHAGNALELAINMLSNIDNDILLITEERQLQSASFHLSFNRVKEHLHFMILLNREGHFSFSQHIHGRSKILNEAQLDLKALLLQPSANPQPARKIMPPFDSLPAFLIRTPLPLLVLNKVNHVDSSEIFGNRIGDQVAITRNQRVLFFTKRRENPMEMLSHINRGWYTFNWVDPDICLILSRVQASAWLYKFDLKQQSVESYQFTLDQAFEPAFSPDGKTLFLTSLTEQILFDCEQMGQERRIRKERSEEFNRPEDNTGWPSALPSANPFKGLFKIKNVYIRNTGQLVLNDFTLDCNEGGIQLILENGIQGKKITAASEREIFFKNTKCKHRIWRWSDGSEAIVDRRGILHLRSAAPGLAEVSIILVTNAQVACWSSENKVCGNSGFIAEEINNTSISPPVFFNTYIKPFISHIVSYAAKP